MAAVIAHLLAVPLTVSAAPMNLCPHIRFAIVVGTPLGTILIAALAEVEVVFAGDKLP